MIQIKSEAEIALMRQAGLVVGGLGMQHIADGAPPQHHDKSGEQRPLQRVPEVLHGAAVRLGAIPLPQTEAEADQEGDQCEDVQQHPLGSEEPAHDDNATCRPSAAVEVRRQLWTA